MTDNCNIAGAGMSETEMLEQQLIQEIQRNCPEKTEQAIGDWGIWKEKNEVTEQGAQAWYEAWAVENQCNLDPWARIEMELQAFILENCPDQ